MRRCFTGTTYLEIDGRRMAEEASGCVSHESHGVSGVRIWQWPPLLWRGPQCRLYSEPSGAPAGADWASFLDPLTLGWDTKAVKNTSVTFSGFCLDFCLSFLFKVFTMGVWDGPLDNVVHHREGLLTGRLKHKGQEGKTIPVLYTSCVCSMFGVCLRSHSKMQPLKSTSKFTPGTEWLHFSSVTHAVKRKAPEKNGRVYSLTQDAVLLCQSVQLRWVRPEVISIFKSCILLWNENIALWLTKNIQ